MNVVLAKNASLLHEGYLSSVVATLAQRINDGSGDDPHSLSAARWRETVLMVSCLVGLAGSYRQQVEALIMPLAQALRSREVKSLAGLPPLLRKHAQLYPELVSACVDCWPQKIDGVFEDRLVHESIKMLVSSDTTANSL